MVAILQPSRFYALRFNLVSGLATVLDNYYQSFYFSGELRQSSWTGETLMLWYVDRNGVNIVQFQFKWYSNNSC
ncbi:hypothetical protein Angca_001979 [Angiostrongylus cantonensis]|nr:hypothetical protein Angca_001979 [Angiostrongylus cantonensis]